MKNEAMTGAQEAREAGADGARRGLVVAVVGSRAVRPGTRGIWALVTRLDELHAAEPVAGIVSGGADGPDWRAELWAREEGVKLAEYLPDYRTHGAAAPHIRNAAIVAAADLVLVVWDGESKGTLSAARHALRLGKPTEWLLAPPPADLAAKPATGSLGTDGAANGAGGGGQLRLL